MTIQLKPNKETVGGGIFVKNGLGKRSSSIGMTLKNQNKDLISPGTYAPPSLFNSGSASIGNSLSQNKVILPQIRSMNPLVSPQSVTHIKQNKWQAHTRQNSGDLVSGKGLFSYKSKNSSKPFTKAIIEEVTKEHFFTRDSKMYKRNGSSMSSAHDVSPTRPRRPLPVDIYKPIRIDIPHECKLLCFC